MSPALDDLRARVDADGGDPSLRCLALLHGAASIGRFDAVDLLLDLAAEKGIPDDRLEETALQVVAYGGFPRALETLGRIAARRGSAPSASAPERRSGEQLRSDGREVWQRVYGRQADAVAERLDQLMVGLAGNVIEGAYGRILSRGVLSLGEREILAVAALALAGLAAPLRSHVRGARLNGFPPSAVEDILSACSVLADATSRQVIAQALDQLPRTVDPP